MAVISKKATRNSVLILLATLLATPLLADSIPVRVVLADKDDYGLRGTVTLKPVGSDSKDVVFSEAVPWSDWLELTPGKEYELSARSVGYFYKIERLTIPSDNLFHEHRVELDKIVPGAVLNARGILFARHDASLAESSMAEVKEIYQLLLDNPKITISIEGHTDSVGPDRFNLNLSKKRAKNVRDALIKLGIDGKRMATKGWGEKKPIASNRTKKGRTQNRRTEVHILKAEAASTDAMPASMAAFAAAERGRNSYLTDGDLRITGSFTFGKFEGNPNQLYYFRFVGDYSFANRWSAFGHIMMPFTSVSISKYKHYAFTGGINFHVPVFRWLEWLIGASAGVAQVNHQINPNVITPVGEVGTTLLIADISWHIALEAIHQRATYSANGVTFDMAQNLFTVGIGSRL